MQCAPPERTVVDRFRAFSSAASCHFGSPWALAIAIVLVLSWAVTGPYFQFSEGWQLVINTGTTIVTFLMAFLIQATQYRESRAVNLKIDELIRAVEGARTGFVNVDSLSDKEIERLATELSEVGAVAKIKPVKIIKQASKETADIDAVNRPGF